MAEVEGGVPVRARKGGSVQRMEDFGRRTDVGVCTRAQHGGTRDNVGILAQYEDDESPSPSPEHGSFAVRQADSKCAWLFLPAAQPSAAQAPTLAPEPSYPEGLEVAGLQQVSEV